MLQRLHLEYASPIDVSSLARHAGMSTSALHLRFREITGTSPVQYVKTIRLHKETLFRVVSRFGSAAGTSRIRARRLRLVGCVMTEKHDGRP